MWQVGDRVRRIKGDFKGMEAIVEGCGSTFALLAPAPGFEEMGELIGSTRGYNWHNIWEIENWELVGQVPTAYLELFV